MAASDPQPVFDLVKYSKLENPPTAERSISGGSVTLSWESLAGGSSTDLASIEDVTADGIIVRLRESVTVGQTVRVRDDLAERKATVQHCERQEDGFLAVLHFVAFDRRREDRLPTAGQGTLHWKDRGGGQIAGVFVRNIAESGVQIELHKRLEPHQTVWLSGEAWECEGRVRYCRREGSKYLAGIQLLRPPYPKGYSARRPG
jgi:hypothetical protein